MVTPAVAAAAVHKDNAISERKARLRLWIRLLRASRFIEGVTRERFKVQFNMTLPRFDVMAALYRQPEGMLMSEIARFLIVSNGNVTGLVDRLVEQGLIERQPSPKDRRAQIVSLTAQGRKFFRAMARTNGDWVGEFFADLSANDIETLMKLLGKTKASARKAIRRSTLGKKAVASGDAA